MKLYEILFEDAREWKLSFWDVIEHKGADNKDNDRLHDLVIPWLNDTNPKVIDKALREPKFKTISQVLLLWDLFYKERKRPNGGFLSQEIVTMSEVERDLEKEVTLWRGGGGTYDPDLYKKGWTSFTHDRSRVDTFAEYDGTHAHKGGGFRKLQKREKDFWVVELKIKITDILLFLPHGLDGEVIVSTDLAKKAKVIVQK